MIDKTDFWALADQVKRRLYGRLRRETYRIDYTHFKKYREEFERIPSALVDEWKKIENDIRGKYKGNINYDFIRLKGFLYEVLFYYACLETQSVFLDAEIIELGGDKPYFQEHPPWFEAIPLYDIIPGLHHIWEEGVRKRKVPQVKADFLVSYADDKGPAPPAFIDVKSSEPLYDENLDWQITAAMRFGFIFRVAYPKHGIEYPKLLSEWEIKTPCSKCEKLSSDSRQCSECGHVIFPFTIVSGRYTLKHLVELLRMSYKGRF